MSSLPTMPLVSHMLHVGVRTILFIIGIQIVTKLHTHYVSANLKLNLVIAGSLESANSSILAEQTFSGK